jgi:hypothetical protein
MVFTMTPIPSWSMKEENKLRSLLTSEYIAMMSHEDHFQDPILNLKTHLKLYNQINDNFPNHTKDEVYCTHSQNNNRLKNLSFF